MGGVALSMTPVGPTHGIPSRGRAILVFVLFGAVAMSLFAGQAHAQYDQRYGEPQRVSVDDLARMPGIYNEKAVIVRGDLRTGSIDDINNNVYELRGESMRNIRVGMPWGSTSDLRFMTGQEVEISGIFFDLSHVIQPERHPILRNYAGAVPRNSVASFGDGNLFLAGMSADSIADDRAILDELRDEEEESLVDPDIVVADSDVVDLRRLVEMPQNYLGKRIAIVGKFRGNNLYSDLSIREKKTPRDFVVKVAEVAIWVTGKRPRGKGFKLDPKKRRDTGKWLRIIGQPWAAEDNLYFKAEKIALVDDPEDPDLEPVKNVAKEKLETGPPPVVTFSLPLDGEREISRSSMFQVQFSNDMDESSFNGNVDLLYVDDDGATNPFPDMDLSYDRFSRTLTVNPNTELVANSELWLIFYQGITDEDNQALVELPGASELALDAQVVLKFFTGR